VQRSTVTEVIKKMKKKLAVLIFAFVMIGTLTCFGEQGSEGFPEGQGKLTIYSKPVRQAEVTVYLKGFTEEMIEVKLSETGVTEQFLPYGSYHIDEEVGVTYQEDCASLYNTPLTFTLVTDIPENMEFTLDEETGSAEIGSREEPAKIFFTYSENEATRGILTEEFESAYLLMDDARFQYVMTPEEESQFYETWPTFSEEYLKKRKEEYESIIEKAESAKAESIKAREESKRAENSEAFAEKENAVKTAEKEMSLGDESITEEEAGSSAPAKGGNKRNYVFICVIPLVLLAVWLLFRKTKGR